MSLRTFYFSLMIDSAFCLHYLIFSDFRFEEKTALEKVNFQGFMNFKPTRIAWIIIFTKYLGYSRVDGIRWETLVFAGRRVSIFALMR